MRSRFLLILAAVGVIGGSAGHAEVSAEVSDDKDQKVSVSLILKEREYDPTKPSQGVLKFVVRNGALEPIVVPVGYDGKQVILNSRELSLQKVLPFRTSVAQIKEDNEALIKMVRLDPGEEKAVFELPLDSILLKGEKSRAEWRWRWGRRPEPPPFANSSLAGTRFLGSGGLSG